MIRAVSANLGRRSAAVEWVRQVLAPTTGDAVDVVFLQEVPLGEDWDGLCATAGFGIATDPESVYRVRSLLLWRKDTISGEPYVLPTSGYHGSYLAAARLDLPKAGSVTAVSVHASPAALTPKHCEQWRSTGRKLPPPRPSGAPSELWDSDMVLATLTELVQGAQVLAAGDFNECLAWDATHPGEWGREYFDRVAESKLVSLAHRDGGAEQRTSFTHEHLEYQLDHVLATADVASLITRRPQPDTAWSRERVIAEPISDHSPLWFEING